MWQVWVRYNVIPIHIHAVLQELVSSQADLLCMYTQSDRLLSSFWSVTGISAIAELHPLYTHYAVALELGLQKPT